MPKTVQIRNLDDDVYAALERQAQAAGISVPDLLRREAERLAARSSLTMQEWLERIRGRTSDIDPAETIKALDEIRAGLGRILMLVVDASALFDALVGVRNGAAIQRRLNADLQLAAPHIIDVEVLGIIRRDFLRGLLSATAAAQAVDDLHDWPGERHDHRSLLRRAWDLRDNVRGWDAMYVALAEDLDAVLITTDARLARAPGLHCRIELP